jgi:hypothetical protein
MSSTLNSISHVEFSCKTKLKRSISPKLSVNIDIWRKIRGPFILPCRISSHRCERHWENIDIDTAGCKMCGSIHVCHDPHTNICSTDPSVDNTPCKISEEHDADVCIVTGLCLSNVRYSDHEALNLCNSNTLRDASLSHHKPLVNSPRPSLAETSQQQRSNSADLFRGNYIQLKNNNFKSRNKSFKSMNNQKLNSSYALKSNAHQSRPHSLHNTVSTSNNNRVYSIVEGCCVLDYTQILEICQYMLCSQTVVDCFKKEQAKLTSRVRSSFMKHVRILKKKRKNNAPVNALGIIGEIAADLYNYRLFPVDISASEDRDSATTHQNTLKNTRASIAELCARIITNFVNHAHVIIKNFMYNVCPKTFVVGVLYLLRVGLTAQHIVLLPEQRILTHILPSENLLNEFFDVKCKCITEVENIIKLQVRMLKPSQVIGMQYTL